MSLLVIINIILIIAILSTLFYWLKNHRLARAYQKQLEATETKLKREIEREQLLTSELAAIRDQVSEEKLHDKLTGLSSRDVFTDRLQQTLQLSKRYNLSFGVLFLDIDGFRVLNEVLGHDASDRLLQEVAARLHTCIRQVDTLSRWMGDTFVVLLPQLAKPETAAYVASRFLAAISQPFHLDKQELFLTASIGIVTYPADGAEAETLMKNASMALRQAKIRSRNTYQFYRDEMQAMSRRELILSSSVRSENIFKELSLHYQPQVNVLTQQIVCMEALLRWQHPDFGLVPPTEFLRLAEYCDRSMEMGEWVLREACQQVAKWKAAGFYPPCISVNISLRQLENPHFTYKLSQILQQSQLEPAALILDISEISLSVRFDLIEKTLHMLEHLGVQIAIDDFGTGYLSLQQLRNFSIDYLKIDSTFVREITTNKESEAICKMIVGLANALNIGLVAEGVETVEQERLLKEMGCQVMQGHLFCVPSPADEFPRMVETIQKGMAALH